jgi:hypothetical protein
MDTPLFIEVPIDRFEMACCGFSSTGQYFTFLDWVFCVGGLKQISFLGVL